MKYVAIEGKDGTGKTQLSKAFAKLIDAHWTFEPNGQTPVSKQLRQYCLDKQYTDEVNWRTRELLLLATRSISTKPLKTILETKDVVSDRSLVSGLVYAHVASGMEFNSWWDMAYNAFWVYPDIIVNVKTKEQKIDKVENDIYDHETDDFHTRIESTFPEAIKFLKSKLDYRVVSFYNDFNKTPMENAVDLLDQINGIDVTIDETNNTKQDEVDGKINIDISIPANMFSYEEGE